MKKQVIIAAAAVAMFAGAASAQDVVRMGTEGAYPPFNYIESDGQLAGFDIEIGNALCEAAEITCEWVTQDWDGIIPGLIAEKYDTIIASMSITDERKEQVDFTEKYYVSPAQFVVAKEDAGMIGEDLEASVDGKVIGVQGATIMENYIKDNFADVAEVKSYDTQEAANLDLTSGRLDAVFGEVFVMKEFLDSDTGSDYTFDGPLVSAPQWFGEGIGIAVRKGEDELREKLNAAIKEIRDNGTYARINEKYFPFDVYGE